jgi:pyruvate dehydrogenase E2 component (dihydrolipoamide acetyltransferase)
MFARNQENRQPAALPDLPLTAVQRETARRLQESKQTIPHFYLNTSANAERIAAAHAAARQQTPPQKLLWDAFFVRAVARALQAYPKMAYRYDGERLRQPATHAIGVAADIDDQLYVVAVENPLEGTIEAISGQIAEKVARIQQGDPAAKRLVPTAFTITNLGAEGIESFQAIINPGETAILAIGRIMPVVQVVESQVMIQKRVHLSLSVDHRVANGRYAARFLGQIVNEIEST